MSIYLDNAAAAPCDAELLEYFCECATEFPGNQESMGWHGVRAQRRIAEQTAGLLNAFELSGYDAFYSNSGTEVLTMAAEALCRLVRKKEIITSTLEHPALEFALKRSCAAHGTALKFCPADRTGVRLDTLEAMLTENTGAVAFHQVQSETGGILDLPAVRKLMDKRSPRALLLADTMQSIGKIPLETRAVRPDFLTLSGQKLGAPGGGVLFCAEKHLRTVRTLRGAEHLSGRCPVPVLLTLIRAGVKAAGNQAANHAHACGLRKILLGALHENGLDFPLTLPEGHVSPFIVHLLTRPYQGAILTRALQQFEISTAPGSACESETPSGSRALSAMGYSRSDSFCGLRISLWNGNTPEEMGILAAKLSESVKNY